MKPNPLAVLLLLIFLTACSSPVRKGSLFLYNRDDPYVDIFGKQIEEAIGGFLLLSTFDSQNSQIIQNEYIQQQIGRSDIMLINPVDRLGAYSIIRRLMEEKIPVIFFNREPLARDLALWDKAYYVGARAEQSGHIQAELIMELFGGEPRRLNRYDRNGNNVIETVILKGEQGHQDAEIRTREVIDAFRDRGFDIRILITEVANWRRNEAYDKMKSILEKYDGTMELLISNNDAMALGAISIMRQSGYFKDDNGNGKADKDDRSWIPVVGIDGLEEAIQMISEGYMYGTVINDSQTQAKAISELTEVILGNRKPEDLSFPLVDGKYIWIDYKVYQ